VLLFRYDLGMGLGISHLSKRLTYRKKRSGVLVAIVLIGLLGTSVPAVAATPPLPVTSITVGEKTTTSVALTWNAPANDGGSPITDYKIEYSSNAGSTYSTFVDGVSAATSATITGLTTGQTYIFRIRSITSLGQSNSALSPSVLAATSPGMITGLTVESATMSSVNLAWSAPQPNGSVIQSYSLQSKLASDSIWQSSELISASLVNASIGMLSARASYQFRVAAINAEGVGPYSEPVEGSTYDLPNAPIDVQVSSYSKSTITIEWNPGDVHADLAALTGFRIQYRAINDFRSTPLVWNDFRDVAPEVHSAEISNLSSGSTYEIRVGAISRSGISWSETPIESVMGKSMVCSTLQSGYVRCWNRLDGALIGQSFLPGLSGLSVGSSQVCGIDQTTYLICGNGKVWTKDNEFRDVQKVSVAGSTICVLYGTSYYGMYFGACWDVGLAGKENYESFGWVVNTWAAENRRGTGTGYYRCFVNKDDTPKCAGWIGYGYNSTYKRVLDWYKEWPELQFEPERRMCKSEASDALICLGYNEFYRFNLIEFVRGKPEAPAKITVSNTTKSSVRISWTAPIDNGLALTSQILDYSNDYGTTWIRLTTLPKNVNSYLSELLAPGDYLRFRLAGVNGEGTGTFIETSEIPIGTVASQVQNPNVTVQGSNSLGISWEAPFDDGGFDVSLYKISYKAYGATTWIEHQTLPSDQYSSTITGLDKGTTYQIRINSINAVGVSDSVFLAETPSIPPSKPVLNNPIVVNRNTVTIPFTIDDDGGMPPTGLFVRSRIIGTGTWENESELVSNQSSVTVQGLPTGELREFQVSAVNIRGSSEYSSASNQILLAEPPSSPVQLSTSVIGGQELQANWAEPSDNGGSPVTGYAISIKQKESTLWSTAVEVSASDLTKSFADLIRGEVYDIRLRAVNAVGASEWVLSSGIPSTVPSRPLGITATISSKSSMNVTWTKSSDSGGQAITSYLVKYSGDSGQTWSEPVSVDASKNSLTVYGLTSGLSYRFSVVAENAVGESTASESAPIPLYFNIAKPIKSLNVSGRTKNSLTVSWTAPLVEQGVTITGFQAQTRLQGQPWRDNILVGTTKSTATLTGLTTGAKYAIRVIPVTAQGRTPLHHEVAVAAGYEFTCALLTDSLATVKCWGSNEKGQLGNGALLDSVLPVSVKDLSNVKEVATGYFHACALTFAGEVYCWGSNESGQLANESISMNSRVPVKIEGLGNVTQLTAGEFFNCATTESGEVFCWGDNEDRQVSSSTEDVVFTPTAVNYDDFFTQVSAGLQHACGVTLTKLVRCWGDNGKGQLGANTDYANRWDLPITWDTNYVFNGNMGQVKSVEAGYGFTCATSMTDELWCWGEGDSGQLGGGQTSFNGGFNYSDDPVYISGSSAGVSSFSAGQSHTCFVAESNDGYCWGWNRHGQVGDPDQSRDPWTYANFADVKNLASLRSISAGGAHTCASGVNDFVFCWGANSRGQTGQALSRTIVETPGVQVDLGIWSPLAVPAAVPSVPVSAKLVSSASKTSLWTIGSASANGSTVIRYEQRTSIDKGKRWTAWKTIKSGDKTTGWVKGKTYLVQIRAVNGIGPGDAKQITFKPTK
jgi:alpha-tubulin suppressor-like RCC1 family protein